MSGRGGDERRYIPAFREQYVPFVLLAFASKTHFWLRLLRMTNLPHQITMCVPATEQTNRQEKEFQISKPLKLLTACPFFFPSIHAALLLQSIDRGGCIEGLPGRAAPTSQGR